LNALGGQVDDGMFIRQTTTGIQFLIGGNGSGAAATYVTMPHDGRWHHVVAVRDSTSLNLYYDGVLGNSTVHNNIDITSTFDLKLGADAALRPGLFYNGIIDELQIYKEALTLSQIQHLYAQGLIRRAVAFRY